MAEQQREEKQNASKPRTYREWLTYGKNLLRAQGIRDADTDAWLLLEYVSSITRTFYSMHSRDPMEPKEAEDYAALLKRRAEHIPVQYLTGEAWFYGESFRVTPDVLIPRQDTEVLVEQAEMRIRTGMRLLDLCTGSGCILLTLAKRHEIAGLGADLSEQALEVARTNQKRLGVHGVSWVKSDLFQNIRGAFDMIVSNPPYISTGEIATLEPEVRDCEPRMALDGKADGLYFEEKIAEESLDFLNPGGWLLLEIGYDQGEQMRNVLSGLGYEETEIIRDLGGNDRVAAGRKRNV